MLELQGVGISGHAWVGADHAMLKTRRKMRTMGCREPQKVNGEPLRMVFGAMLIRVDSYRSYFFILASFIVGLLQGHVA